LIVNSTTLLEPRTATKISAKRRREREGGRKREGGRGAKGVGKEKEEEKTKKEEEEIKEGRKNKGKGGKEKSSHTTTHPPPPTIPKFTSIFKPPPSHPSSHPSKFYSWGYPSAKITMDRFKRVECSTDEYTMDGLTTDG
jgi:hypothetical protein